MSGCQPLSALSRIDTDMVMGGRAADMSVTGAAWWQLWAARRSSASRKLVHRSKVHKAIRLLLAVARAAGWRVSSILKEASVACQLVTRF
ncbi:hypothetical protein KIM372_13230 [Bombiscardovia nodaiensis]|uniref:Transposase n=1 Tax=Bombiscardovia nodaiensis TaxID=2932181 RepID=A0ABM8B9D3_9BIFI|nr:hypothetical protein KIM372_13230 [Bombiscardovia nodaiensis]